MAFILQHDALWACGVCKEADNIDKQNADSHLMYARVRSPYLLAGDGLYLAVGAIDKPIESRFGLGRQPDQFRLKGTKIGRRGWQRDCLEYVRMVRRQGRSRARGMKTG